MRRDPFAKPTSSSPSGPLQHFTDREQFIGAFHEHLSASDDREMQVLCFYGVGGIGKTTLMQRLCADLDAMRPAIPYARFNLENVADPTQAYREVILRMRADLENSFGVDFPHFDLGMGVILAREGGEAPPLMNVSPHLKAAIDIGLELSPTLLKVTSKLVNHGVEQALEKSEKLRHWVRKVGGTSEVVELSQHLIEDDSIILDELVRRFAQDLSKHLPERRGLATRGVLFLDTYEALWTGRESGSAAQARLLDEWVRLLAEYCLASGVLLVVTGREGLGWAESDPDWAEMLDQRLLGGLSELDAQTLLSKRGIGPGANSEPTELQTAIIRCCNTTPDPEGQISCHLLYTALCADIVLNTRETGGDDPPPSMFAGVPSSQAASALATRFLKSMHNRNLELWVEALSLTPRFDEETALALDTARQYHNGRAGWEQLTRYSFVLAQPDGFYRMHRTMREALKTRIPAATQRTLHQWFDGYWLGRGEPALGFYHHWRLDPTGTLAAWVAEHEAALATLQVKQARTLLTHWAEVALDGDDRLAVDDVQWAKTHAALGQAMWNTPLAPRQPMLNGAIEHFLAALSLYSPVSTPVAWADANLGLALCYMYLPDDRSERLRGAMICLRDSLTVYSPEEHPEQWAHAQNHLGIVWAKLPFQTEEENRDNQRCAIGCFEATVQVWTEQSHAKIWARGQHNLGVSYMLLPAGDRRANLECAVEYFEAALRVRTREDHPTGWALTQYNLGEVYLEMPGGGDAEFARAVSLFEASLEVYTEEDYPGLWAAAQHSLGLAWRDMPVEDRLQNLEKALEYFDCALRVWTEEDDAEDWAGAHRDIGVVLREMAGIDGSHDALARAASHFADSERAFRAAGCFEEADRSSRERAALQTVTPYVRPSGVPLETFSGRV